MHAQEPLQLSKFLHGECLLQCLNYLIDLVSVFLSECEDDIINEKKADNTFLRTTNGSWGTSGLSILT
jgi:hypothetical protein